MIQIVNNTYYKEVFIEKYKNGRMHKAVLIVNGDCGNVGDIIYVRNYGFKELAKYFDITRIISAKEIVDKYYFITYKGANINENTIWLDIMSGGDIAKSDCLIIK